ncbi:Tat pathway signal sequence domain protein [Novosphingobium piscinae]|uniref:Tat pathway signal sequence domain protein n=1 Tax=Novosphingobium piscinae TaxID=1507448 RepID=A0A7X1KNF6_9SPHN|nr:Tat pathway signal sequence domain protein [Novosphingobium piscinae]MBC2667634.1 Tat pathway signal sequence domain protein [Novosphingobium piscinae]
MTLRRRDVLSRAALVGAVATAPGGALLARAAGIAPPGSGMAGAGQADVTVGWLDGAPPARDEGQCWGQPWPRGTAYARRGYHLVQPDGTVVPLQTWPLAWWPDGSVKWTGHAAPADAMRTAGGQVRPGPAPLPVPLVLSESEAEIAVTCAGVTWRVPRRGTALIASATQDGTVLLADVALTATAQDGPAAEPGESSRTEAFSGMVRRAIVEQGGPVRAVIRLEGDHRPAGSPAAEGWLPFSLRLYFHAGSRCVRIVHSLVFDGDPAVRFVKGLGLTGRVPLRGALHDRHVRFGGEDGGLWAEAVRPLTGLRRDPGEPFRAAQVAGRAVPPLETMAPVLRGRLDYVPAWGDFTLAQPNADGFTIVKRTAPGHGWVDVDGARRAPGFGYVGSPAGGVGFGLADFWQRAPVRLDIRDAASDTARFALWYHAPDAPAMDLRFYHDGLGMADYYRQNQGLDATYEDYEPGWGTAQGIARSTEFRLWALPATPPRAALAQMAQLVARPPRLIARSAAVHVAGLFGPWAAPDRSSPALAALEDRAQSELDFYLGQVEQRRWYGFWNYGDVMHSYDNDRHVWRYDIGGFAWDNSELSTDLWLWYAYLRTGRADLFRLAEAMCRHTGEVDVYHTGRFKGLGTRHGVQHWGDSSKQPRISNAAYRRIHYYLTADERSGDLMRALLGSEERLREIDIERKTGDVERPGGKPRPQRPAGQVEMAFGTVWSSLAAAWLAEWERTGDRRWRDRIVAGMESIAALPQRWFAGYAVYDLASGRFSGGETVRISHLNGAFGAFELHAELLELVDMPAYREAWLDYCEFYNAPAAAFTAKTGARVSPGGLRQGHARFTAYAAVHRRRPDLARRAWAEFAEQGDRPDRVASRPARRVDGADVLKPVDEIIGMSTNDAAQWGLGAIQLSALIGRFAPSPASPLSSGVS